MITINDLKEKLPRKYKISAIASVIFGFIAYGYIFLNPIYMHDASGTSWAIDILENIYSGASRMTPFTGVWFYLQGKVQVPLYAGIICLFICGLAAFLVCDYLEIKNDIVIVLIAGIMTVCPALISANTYGTGGLPFVMAMFFASAGVWIIKKNTPWSYLVAILCLFVSAATYTSYLQWAACIFIIKQIKSLIEQDEINIRQFLKKDVQYAFILFVSTCMDILVSIILMKNSGYSAQGRVYGGVGLDGGTWSTRAEYVINNFKTMVLEWLPPCVTNRFNKTMSYYSVFEYNTILWVLFFTSWLILLLLIIDHVNKFDSKKTRWFLLMFHGVVLFFAMDILTYVTLTHVLMQYAHIAPWILLLAVADTIIDKEEFSKKISKIAQYTFLIMCVFTILYESLIANVAYQKGESLFRTGVLAANRIMGRLESIEGYEEETDVFFVGELHDYGAPENRSDFYLANGLTGVGTYGSAYTYALILQTYLAQYIGNDIHYACDPAWARLDAEQYFEYLNANGQYDGCEEEFIEKFNSTNDLPMADNYFWFHDILVFRLETQ